MAGKNNKIPTDILEQLAQDNDDKVRLAVAYNLSCTINILKWLIEDNNKTIRYVAKQNIENKALNI